MIRVFYKDYMYRLLILLAFCSPLYAMQEIASLKKLCLKYLETHWQHPAIHLNVQDPRLPYDISEYTDCELTEQFATASLWFEEKLPNFLAHNISINYQDKDGNTALHFIARKYWYAHIPELIQLVEFGADYNIQNKLGQRPIDDMNSLVACYVQSMNTQTATALLCKVYRCPYIPETIRTRTIEALLIRGASMPPDYTACIKTSYNFLVKQCVYIKKTIRHVWDNYIFVKV